MSDAPDLRYRIAELIGYSSDPQRQIGDKQEVTVGQIYAEVDDHDLALSVAELLQETPGHEPLQMGIFDYLTGHLTLVERKT